MKNRFIVLIVFSIILSSCYTYEKQTAETSANYASKSEEPPYQASRTKIFDLIHTDLDLKFNFIEKSAHGKAIISLKPHFYAQDSVQLDARGFEIISLSKNETNLTKPLDFSYNGEIITIKLDKKYSRKDTLVIAIEYKTFPDKLPENGSWAIRSDKGLYFIDSQTDNPQIWTQGETQSNSAWFPTIDAPNQKMSQRIRMTVPSDFKTLSNGILIYSVDNEDNTRTDTWLQTKPHAPYLAMIAVGRFEILKNSWSGIDVNVYAEKHQTQTAKALFAKTDKMLRFFSEKLDVAYPWDKYSQIVVREFVSGAMENTSATVFGDYVLTFRNETERIEYETVVAHELSHHWFGDLVTCESWANLPLNESFATYFEYLWLEHEYGRETADEHLVSDKNSYMFEYIFKNEELIRFHHTHRDDMFDSHSYQKGSLILHYLRKTVGDEAFWDALELYLKQNQYKTAEIHDLRLAFEEVTGQDLNWFFNEFFLNKGYPQIYVRTKYNSESKAFTLTVSQNQNLSKAPHYKLPLDIDFYFQDTIIRQRIVLANNEHSFDFKFDTEPLLTIADAESAVPGKIQQSKNAKEYLIQGSRAKLYVHVTEALDFFKSQTPDDEINEMYLKLTDYPFAPIRKRAITQLKVKPGNKLYDTYKQKLEQLSKNDLAPEVRTAAKIKLSK